EPAEHRIDDRVGDDGERYGEEPVRADRVHQRRYRDEGVRRVRVAAEQEPGDPVAEGAPAQPPLLEVLRLVRAPPPGRHEAEYRHEPEHRQEDRELDPVLGEAGHQGRRRVSWYTSVITPTSRNTKASWHQ